MLKKESLATPKEVILSYIGFVLWVIVLFINDSITGGGSYNIYLWITGVIVLTPTLVIGGAVIIRATRLTTRKYTALLLERKIIVDLAEVERRKAWKDISMSHLEEITFF